MASKIDKELWRYCKKMQGNIEMLQDRVYKLEHAVKLCKKRVGVKSVGKVSQPV